MKKFFEVHKITLTDLTCGQMIAIIIIVEIQTMIPMVPGVTQQIQKFAGRSAISDGATLTKVLVKLLVLVQILEGNQLLISKLLLYTILLLLILLLLYYILRRLS